MNLHHGDCIEVMATLPEASVDAIVTDPPYGLEFMGKAWDQLSGVDRRQPGDPTWHPSKGDQAHNRMKVRYGYGNSNIGAAMYEWHQAWAEAAYRVAKPSAYLLAFGGTRTVHRMTCALEDAGWIIRDMLVWGYASGFPKSKASLKPAWEPIVMARKPGPLRMLAIDECRIGVEGGTTRSHQAEFQHEGEPGRVHATRGYRTGHDIVPVDGGRWPANIVLTEPIFDGGIEGVVGGGEVKAGVAVNRNRTANGGYGGWAGAVPAGTPDMTYGDTGTYSRFFLVPKAARSDREPVLRPDYAPRRETAHRRTGPMDTPFLRGETMRLNPHPTVKPVDLMRHLVRLVTPVGGILLDPFLGSGTTALAAEMEGFEWIGIEREEEYIAIAKARLNGTQKGLAL